MSELGDVLELMHTSEERWRSLRAEGREWRHQALHLEAFMRMVERRSGSVSVLGGSSEEVEEPEETESTWGLWMERRHKVRAEFAVGHGEMVTAVVDGPTWWSWSPSTGALTNEGSENAETGLGPGTALVHPALILPAIDLEIRGRTTRLDRSVYEVLVAPTAGDDEDEESSGLLHGIGSGAEEYELLVDAERGVLLRTEARLHGRPFLILEVDEVAFDEELPEGTFTLAPPSGEEFEAVPLSRSLLLEELPRAVGFAVLVPERVPDNADVDVMIEPALPRHSVPEHGIITYETFDRDTTPTSLVLRESAAPMPLPEKTEWRDVGGIVVAEDRHTDPPTIRVRLEMQGTHVELSSRDLPIRQLLDMGRSLVPLPPVHQ